MPKRGEIGGTGMGANLPMNERSFPESRNVIDVES
jgi:hypothetical protein